MEKRRRKKNIFFKKQLYSNKKAKTILLSLPANFGEKETFKPTSRLTPKTG